ncbi:hypothetical protein ACFX16_022755 [Malus domestica]
MAVVRRRSFSVNEAFEARAFVNEALESLTSSKFQKSIDKALRGLLCLNPESPSPLSVPPPEIRLRGGVAPDPLLKRGSADGTGFYVDSSGNVETVTLSESWVF